jgi:hypothetical protein
VTRSRRSGDCSTDEPSETVAALLRVLEERDSVRERRERRDGLRDSDTEDFREEVRRSGLIHDVPIGSTESCSGRRVVAATIALTVSTDSD